MPKTYYERYKAIVWRKPEFVGKKSKYQSTLADLEAIYPKGQKHLAKALGVHPRTIRKWKTGERHPTQAHVAKLLHKKQAGERFVSMVQRNYNLDREKAISKIRSHYKREQKKAPEQKETDKWLPPYPLRIDEIEEEEEERRSRKRKRKKRH